MQEELAEKLKIEMQEMMKTQNVKMNSLQTKLSEKQQSLDSVTLKLKQTEETRSNYEMEIGRLESELKQARES